MGAALLASWFTGLCAPAQPGEGVVVLDVGAEDDAQALAAARALVRRELWFLRQVCRPTKAEYERIEQHGDEFTRTLAADRADAVLARRTLTFGRPKGDSGADVREVIHDHLAAALERAVSAVQATRYREEWQRREAYRRRVITSSMVAVLDRPLVLRAVQRESLAGLLVQNWQPEWEYFYELRGADFVPRYVPLLKQLEEILGEKQRPLWTARAGNRRTADWSGWIWFGGLAGQDGDDEDWQEFEPEEHGAADPPPAFDRRMRIPWPGAFQRVWVHMGERDAGEGFDRSIFGDLPLRSASSGSCAERWKLAMSSILELRIDEIDENSPLMEDAKQKLALAGRGETERILERVASTRAELLDTGAIAEDVPFMARDAPSVHPLRASVARALYDEAGLFQKTVDRVLTDDARAAYRKLEAERRAFHHRAMVESGLLGLIEDMALLAGQCEGLTELLVEASSKSECVGDGESDTLKVLLAFDGIPESKLAHFLDGPQLRRLRARIEDALATEPEIRPAWVGRGIVAPPPPKEQRP